MKRFFQLGVGLVLLPVMCVAQWQAPAVGAVIIIAGSFFFFNGTKVEQECHKDQLWNVTYRTYLGLGVVNIVDSVEGPLGPCVCQVSGAQIRPKANGLSALLPAEASTFSLLRPREGNCTSGDTSGLQQTIPGQAAAAATGGFGGSGGGFAGGGSPGDPPGPPNPPGSSGTAADQPARMRLASRATSGSAFTYTLPFRDLPAGPLIAEATSPVPWACNSNINPTMFRVYHVDAVVDRYNLCTGQVMATINVPALPLQVRVTPDGSQAIVTSYAGAISFIDTGTNSVVGSVGNSGDPNFTPSGVAISPNGQYALVTNYEPPPDAYVSVVDMPTRTIKSKISLDTEYPESIFINPDGTLAWITFPWDNILEVMDILTGTQVQRLAVNQPFSIVFSPTGTKAFIASGGGSVEVMDTSTYQVVKTIPTGFGATDLQITPDGASVFVNNSAAGSVTVIDTQSLTGTTTNLGGKPQGSVLVPSK